MTKYFTKDDWTETNKRGAFVNRTSLHCGAQSYENHLYNKRDGFKRFNCPNDCAYYQTWVNANTFEFISYCEGDIIHVYCSTEEIFKAELAHYTEWNERC